MWRLARPFFLSNNQGADTPIYLATDQVIQEVTGKYFVKRKASPSSKLSYEKGLQESLWYNSCQLLEIPMDWGVDT